MGDFTSEQVFSTTADAGAALRDALVAGPDQRVLDAMTGVYDAATGTVKFRGAGYDHEQHLPHLLDAFGTGAVDALPHYTPAAMLQLRHLTAGDAGAQATGILNMLAQAQTAPDRLLPLILEDLQRGYQRAKDLLAAQTGPAAVMSRNRRAEMMARAGGAVRDFTMTAGDVLRVMELAPIGGFFPGEAPAELTALDARHTPTTGGLIGLGRAFGFVKTLVEPYEAASMSGGNIVHVQAYGA